MPSWMPQVDTDFHPTLPVIESGCDLVSWGRGVSTADQSSNAESWSQDRSETCSFVDEALEQLQSDDEVLSEPPSPWLGAPIGEFLCPFRRQCSAGSNRSFNRQISPSVCLSAASSSQQYGEPSQTLIFLDWDDTLFPFTELFRRQKLSKKGMLPLKLDQQLQPWRDAVYKYLCTASSLSDRCLVVTNSKRPWVDTCIERFAPNLKELFSPDQRGGRARIGVVYAGEVATMPSHSDVAPRSSTLAGCGGCFAGARSLAQRLAKELCEDEEASCAKIQKALTASKRVAMERAATEFYSQYHGQTWKNVVSIGDAPYELDALRELCASRQAERRLLLQDRTSSASESAPASVGSLHRERLRAKVIAVRPRPTLVELTRNLHLSNVLLEAFVRLDDDVDLDLRTESDRMARIAEALGISQLGAIAFPPHKDVGGGEPSDAQTEAALEEVAVAVNEAITDDVQPGTPRPGLSFTEWARKFTMK